MTIRGGWGTSFRAPNFGENSLLVNAGFNAFGLPSAIFNNNNQIQVTCDAAGNALPGSGGEKLRKAGFACGSTPAGLSFNGGAKAPNTAGWRTYFNQDGQVLHGEQSLNWTVGVEYSPTNNFLKGLNVAATWYSIKITSLLVGFGNPTTGSFNNSALGFAYIVPSDLRDAAGVQRCPGMDLTPQNCTAFQDMIKATFGPAHFQHDSSHRPDFDLLAQ